MSAGETREEGRSAAVETARIMEEITRRVEERKASGTYSEEDMAAIADMELRLLEREEYGVEMDRLVSWLHAHWEATGPVAEEGRAIAGTARERVKKTLRSLLSPLSRLLLAKQNQINAKLVQLLAGALPPLREGTKDMEERLEELALRLEQEHGDLRREVRELSARLARMEESGEDGQPRRGEG